MRVTARILIIEDDVDQRTLLTAQMQSLGHEVESLENSRSVATKVSAFKPDIVLLDLGLPDYSGIEVLKFLKKNNDIGYDIIIVSAQTEQETVIEALANGATDYIRKPYIKAELALRISHLIDARQMKHSLLATEQKSVEHKRALASFISPAIVERVFDGSISPEPGVKYFEGSILFVRIRNSDELTAQLSDDEFMQVFNQLYSDMNDLISGQKGEIINSRGDSMIISAGIFNELSDDSPANVCFLLAKRLMEHMQFFNQFKPAFLKSNVEVGMGIASGRLCAGNIGNVNRLEFTVLGEPVRRAEQLEAKANESNLGFLIDAQTKELVGEPAGMTQILDENVFSVS